MFEMLAEMFFRPIIATPSWKDTITEEQKVRIKFERMKQIEESNGEKITMATDYEALIYIMTASLENPLSTMWTRIYSHLFKKFYPDKADFISDHEATLQLQDKGELNNLKRWLWKKSKP